IEEPLFMSDGHDAGDRLAFFGDDANFECTSKRIPQIKEPRYWLGRESVPPPRQHQQTIEMPDEFIGLSFLVDQSGSFRSENFSLDTALVKTAEQSFQVRL